jgi:hypothetical protein
VQRKAPHVASTSFDQHAALLFVIRPLQQVSDGACRVALLGREHMPVYVHRGADVRVAREVLAQPARPFDYLAVVGELWGEGE